MPLYRPIADRYLYLPMTGVSVAVAAGCACAVVAGIHRDGATPAEIAAIVANVEAGVTALVAALHGKDER